MDMRIYPLMASIQSHASTTFLYVTIVQSYMFVVAVGKMAKAIVTARIGN